MASDLILGFREKPEDLAETLVALGFTIDRVVPKDNAFAVTIKQYGFYDPARSARGVHLVYHDGTYADHHETWKSIVEYPNTVVATASVTTAMGRNACDEKKQRDVARFLRDHYGAILYDPQSGTLITDVNKTLTTAQIEPS